MAKGGARARSGPPPDPLAQVRDRKSDQAGWTTLPAAGRRGETPVWPLVAPSFAVEHDTKHGLPVGDLPDRVFDRELELRELELWEREWRRPQAIMWERNGQEFEVALYVRASALAERPDAPTNLRNLVRQSQEALGLSMPGLLRNRWKVAAVEAVVEASAPARAGLKVVPGGA